MTALAPHKENIFFAIICLGGLLVLGLLGLKPLYNQSRQLDEKIINLQTDAKRQLQIASLMAVIDRRLLANSHTTLPEFKAAPLPAAKAGQVLADIKKIAGKAHLKLVDTAPELNNKKADWHNLSVRTKLRGHFPDMRKFILDLLTLPYIRGIDRLKISSDKDLLLEIVFTLRLN